jgi:POTRA domain, FtsQ-type
MTVGVDTAGTRRFLRPSDVGRIRRNHRRIQAQRILGIASRVVLALAVVAAGLWLWQHTQSDARFAVKHIEIAGATHTPRAALQSVTSRYVGTNLFRIELARVQSDLRDLSWVQRIAIEKKLPDTLRINVTERTPVALVRDGERLVYVDEQGVRFAELSPSVGDDDLPIIDINPVERQASSPVDAPTGEDARRSTERVVAFLRDLRAHDPALYTRISEVRPIAPRGFALFDRELGAVVYANPDDVSSKWRSLYAIARAEGLAHGGIAYADLRFADRVIVKPVHPITTRVAAPLPAAPPAQITN